MSLTAAGEVLLLLVVVVASVVVAVLIPLLLLLLIISGFSILSTHRSSVVSSLILSLLFSSPDSLDSPHNSLKTSSSDSLRRAVWLEEVTRRLMMVAL